MTLKECYAVLHGNYPEVMERLKKEAVIIHFIGMFIQEDSLAQLQRALAAGDGPAAFRAAHSLKGNCMSLGFTRLQKAAEAIAEPLRVNRLEKALPLLAPLEEEYGRTVRTIRELNG